MKMKDLDQRMKKLVLGMLEEHTNLSPASITAIEKAIEGEGRLYCSDSLGVWELRAAPDKPELFELVRISAEWPYTVQATGEEE